VSPPAHAGEPRPVIPGARSVIPGAGRGPTRPVSSPAHAVSSPAHAVSSPAQAGDPRPVSSPAHAVSSPAQAGDPRPVSSPAHAVSSPAQAEDPRPVSSPAQAGDPRLASSIGHGSTPSRGPALDALSDLAGQRLETSGDGSDSQPTADQPTVSSTVFPDAGSEGFQLLSTGSTSLAKSRIDVSAFASGMPPKRNELESSKSPSRARRAS
jgi:hypothetical protein